MNTVAVLFARRDSIYKTIQGCDVYDEDRDARTFGGGVPIVAHPPCRAWGNLRHFAKPLAHEKALAPWAVDQVRKYGGVLEHPKRSTLWPYCGLPHGRERDKHGGFTLPIFQSWFGHRAEKATLLYICGCEPGSIPAFPLMLGDTLHVIAQRRTLKDGRRLRKGMPGWRPETTKAEREHTPIALALWLIEIARRCAA